MDLCNDYLLLQSWLLGDRTAGKLLVIKSYEKVQNQVAFRLNHSIPDFQNIVKDITQEAFTRAFEKIDRYNGSTLFSTWVVGFASNCIHERFREIKRETSLVAKFEHTLFPVSEELSDPESVFISNDERQSIKKAFLSLPIQYQEIIYMRLELGISYKEISRELNKSVESLESTFRRALNALRNELMKI